MTLTDIRAALETEHPVLTEQVNGEVRTIAELERADLLERWAAAQFAEWTAAQQAAARKVWPNAQTFVAEFTPAEVAGIALSAAPVVAAMRFKLTTWFGEIHSDNADVLAGLDALVEATILTPERRTQILTP